MNTIQLSFYQKTFFLASFCIATNTSAMIVPPHLDRTQRILTEHLNKIALNQKSLQDNPVRYFQNKTMNEIDILRAAATNNFPRLQLFIIDKKVDINAKTVITGRTALHLAANNGNIKTGKFLIEYGAYVNAQDCNGNTPLHYAIYQNNIEFIHLLLNNGANQTIRNKFGHRPETFLPYKIGESPAEGLNRENNRFIAATHAALLCNRLHKLQLTDL